MPGMLEAMGKHVWNIRGHVSGMEIPKYVWESSINFIPTVTNNSAPMLVQMTF